MNKNQRQQLILELIDQHRVTTQEELADRLRGKGYHVTQATISRDIRELNLTKVPAPDGGQRYASLTKDSEDLGDKFIRVLRDGFVSMDKAQNMLVIRTVSGMAMAVAAAVDAMHFDQVLGCIAGDDTIFVAMRSARDTDALIERISGMLNAR
ncbi:MAG: arginine repressor [Lachnospiraceae bacterium]|jgi:transcriptional regulator of arginine metabolism|nr:arginine repressor [Lachnospiraceae bacterium]MCR5426908.1 arginine repressor [Lachnospiraceae bacterium]